MLLHAVLLLHYHLMMCLQCCWLQAGERGDREVAFYAAIEQHRQQVDPASTEGSSSSADPDQRAAADTPSDEHEAQAAAIMQRLAQWVPRSCEWDAAIKHAAAVDIELACCM